MKLLGLTGGIGMGKSTSAEILLSMECAVIDTDSIARELVKPGTKALREIGEAFGSEIITDEGELNRTLLAERIFSDSKARNRLEAILHPRIRAVWLRKVSEWRSTGVGIGIVVIPLLFEIGVQSEFDAVITVACAHETQKARLIERGWNEVEIGRRMAAQLPVDDKITRADWIVWSEGTLAVHKGQLERILAFGA